MTSCVFCDIVARNAPASIVDEGEHTVAFLDLRQPNPGHVLIVTRRHVERIHSLHDEEAAALLRTAVRLSRALDSAFSPDGLSVWQSNGAAAGQEVPHVHLHLLPRWEDDGLFRVYPGGVPGPTPRASLDRHAEALHAALSPGAATKPAPAEE